MCKAYCDAIEHKKTDRTLIVGVLSVLVVIYKRKKDSAIIIDALSFLHIWKNFRKSD